MRLCELHLKNLRITFGTLRGERAVAVIEGEWEAEEIRGLTDFIKMLQSNDYNVTIDPSGLDVINPVEAMLTAFAPLVREGRLLPFEVCVEPLGIQKEGSTAAAA